MTEFEQVYRTYLNDVFLYIRRLSGDEQTAEEITAETFFKAMRSIKHFRGECDIRVWLCQIAKNSYLTHLKETGRTDSIEDTPAEKLSDNGNSVEDKVIQKDVAMHIRQLLHGIKEPYREVFMWRVYAELSFKQIGRIFGKSENWACVTYHRARNMIRQGLGDFDNEK